MLIFLFLIASELGDLYIFVSHLGFSFYTCSIFLLYFMLLFFLLIWKTCLFILDTNPMTFRHCQYCKNFSLMLFGLGGYYSVEAFCCLPLIAGEGESWIEEALIAFLWKIPQGPSV